MHGLLCIPCHFICVYTTADHARNELGAPGRGEKLLRGAQIFKTMSNQARNQLGTPNWAKSFLRGAQIF